MEKNAFCAIAQKAFFLLYYSDDRFSAGDGTGCKRSFRLLAHTATYVATSDFPAELISELLFKGTHFCKQAVATLSYSPASTLHPQVIYAIAFSAGLNGFQVD